MASSSRFMGPRFRKLASQTLSAALKEGSSVLKSRSLSEESLAHFNSRLSLSGEEREVRPVSWKRLSKRSPWLNMLRPHQRRGVEAAYSVSGFAALFAQRTGKTWVTGALLEVEKEEVHDVLLIGPLTNLKSTWVTFLETKLPWYSVHLDLESFRKSNQPHRILLLNYEAVTPLVKKLRKMKWDRMVIDEAQRLKNRTSRSSKDAMILARAATRRLALTGTPMDQDPKDLWAIMRYAMPSLFGDAWKTFEEEFLVMPHLDPEKMKKGVLTRQKELLRFQIAKRKAPMRDDMMDEFAERIMPHAMRITTEDAGIETAEIHHHLFDLPPEEAKYYRQMEKKMLVRIDGGSSIKAPMKVTQIGKLQQITGGHIKDEDGEVHRIGTAKRRELRGLLLTYAEPGNPFVVFCKYVWEVHMLHRMLERMGYGKGAMLWGKVKDIKTDPRRTRMLKKFQAGGYDFIVCQQRTGGVGVDLYRARLFFVYSMGHSFIDYDQMLARGNFLEQKSRAHYFLLGVRNSIDTDIFSAVDKKLSITEQFYGRMKHH